MKTTYNKIQKTLCLGFAVFTFGIITAQDFNTAYFSDGYLYRHDMNPSIGNEHNYISIPALGNININATGNIGINKFIMPVNNKLTTFMNGDVDAKTFLGELNDDNKINICSDITILSSGFKMAGGYSTIEIGTHVKGGLGLPKTLFEFMKEMKNNTTYNMNDLKAGGKAYADIAFGHSRNVNENLRLGGKVKLLFGLAYADAAYSSLSATPGEDAWIMHVDGKSTISAGGNYKVNKDGHVDGYENTSIGINGFGLGIDIGGVYDFKDNIDGLKVSLALTDLGFISWKDCQVATSTKTDYTFNGFTNMGMHEGEAGGTFDDQWDIIRDDLEELINVDPNKEASTKASTGIGATMTIGVEYQLQSYKKLSFGFLFNNRFDDYCPFTEARLSANYKPFNVLDLAVSCGLNSYGTSLGLLANINCKGFNMFIGTDCLYTGKINKDMIPLDKSNVGVNFGINIPF